MGEEKGYNGWSNYATWLVSLHLSNDEGTYNYVNELAQEAIDNAKADEDTTKKQDAAYRLSGLLKDVVEEANPLADSATMFSDMVQYMIDSADYYEIAENWLAEFEIDD